MTKVYKGSCLCSQVRFEVASFSERAANCHCSMCRKFHGAAFATLVAVEQLNWLSGLEYLKHYSAENGTIRTFCSACGSSLGFRTQGQPLQQMELAISTFDEKLPVVVSSHIFTKYKADWHNINDTLPQFSEGADS